MWKAICETKKERSKESWGVRGHEAYLLMQSSRYRKREKLQANTEMSQLYGMKDLQTHFKKVKVCFEIRFKLHLFLAWYLTGPRWHWDSFGCYTWSSGKLCYFLETVIIFKNSTWQLLEVKDQRKQITRTETSTELKTLKKKNGSKKREGLH